MILLLYYSSFGIFTGVQWLAGLDGWVGMVGFCLPFSYDIPQRAARSQLVILLYF